MKLFKKNYNFIGIDIGEKYIKLAQVKDNKGAITVENYAKEDVSEIISEGKVLEPIKIQTIIKDYIKKNVITNPYLIFSLQNKGSDYSLTKIFELNKLDKKDEQLNAIKIELEDRFPLKENFNTKNIYYDDINNPEKVMVYGTMYRQNIFDDYVAIMKDYNIPYEVTSKNLLYSNAVSEEKTTMIIDIGHNHTDYLVYQNQLPICVKNTNIGGNTITNIIANLGGMDVETAENLKINQGQMLTEIDVFSVIPEPIKQLSNFLEMQFAMIVNDAKRVIQQLNLDMRINIDDIVITGGSSKIKFLDQYLTEQIGIPCRKLILDFLDGNQDEELMAEVQYLTGSILASYDKINPNGLELILFEREKDFKKYFIIGGVIFLTIFMLINGIMFTVNTLNKNKLSKLEKDKVEYQTTLDEITKKHNEYVSIINENVQGINTSLSKKESLESLTKDKKSYYPVIQTIKAHTPTDVQVDVMKINKNNVQLKGIVNDYKTLGFFIKDLESVEGFENIEFSFEENKETRSSNKGDLVFTNLEFIIRFNFTGDGTNFVQQ